MPGRLLIAAGGVAARPEHLPPGVRALIDAADHVGADGLPLTVFELQE